MYSLKMQACTVSNKEIAAPLRPFSLRHFSPPLMCLGFNLSRNTVLSIFQARMIFLFFRVNTCARATSSSSVTSTSLQTVQRPSFSFCKIDAEFPASVSTESLLTVNRAINLGPDVTAVCHSGRQIPGVFTVQC